MSAPLRINVGDVFGELRVLGRAPDRPPQKRRRYFCQCKCKRVIDVAASDLNRGHTTRCRSCVITTHGHSHTPEYQAYRAMLSRCYTPSHTGFKYWGGRGIRVCDRWRNEENGLQHFLEDMGPRPAGFSLERIDNDADYTPENCHWIPRGAQARNKRNNRRLTAFGKTMLATDWCRVLNLPLDTLLARLKKGDSIERALRPSLRYAVILAVDALKRNRPHAEILRILEPQIPV